MPYQFGILQDQPDFNQISLETPLSLADSYRLLRGGVENSVGNLTLERLAWINQTIAEELFLDQAND